MKVKADVNHQPLRKAGLEEVLLHAAGPGHHGPRPAEYTEGAARAEAVHHMPQLMKPRKKPLKTIKNS